MVVEQAGRWEMSPFAVAQCTFSYKGRLGYEGKLIQAVLEGSPMARRIVASLMDYQFGGEGEGRYVIASAMRVSETEPRAVKVTLLEARTSNEHWKIRPDQMLCYHAARVWARRWAPSILLGVYTIDEIYNPEPAEADGLIIEGEAVADAPTRDEINASIPLKPDAVETVTETRKPGAPTRVQVTNGVTAMLAKIAEAQGEPQLAALHKQIGTDIGWLNDNGYPELADDLANAYDLQNQRLRGEEAAA
jgi:hypothetical protein